jgi:succinate-acetate transporter protein
VSHIRKRGVFEEFIDQENDMKLFSEIQSAVAGSNKTLANPAAVGLGAFGATTMLLQFHNLGFVGVGAVMWLAFFFGGLAQLVAGFLEYRNGNNFGFAAFTTYGSFWIALGGIWLNSQLKFTAISGTDVGWFLVVFTLLTGIYLIGAMRQNNALSWVFLTLFIGFILLDIGHLVPGAEVFNKIAAVELIVCALAAWYLMAHIVFTPLKINVPAGKAWVR